MPPKLNNKENKKQNFLKLKILNLICYSQNKSSCQPQLKLVEKK